MRKFVEKKTGYEFATDNPVLIEMYRKNERYEEVVAKKKSK